MYRPSGAKVDRHGILVVDDDPGVIQLLRRMLSDHPTVRFATRGADALRIAREVLPDLVLLDAEMPDMSGFDVCRELKADPALQDIPVVFVTAHDDIAFETRALTLGAADFIPKPFSAPRVRLRVQLHLKLKRQFDLLRSLAEIDGLTGVANRRRLDEAIEREWRDARRTGRALSLLMVDVDEFKRFNDTYGHPAGDECLKAVSSLLGCVARRPRDLLGRYGGEEFMLILPDTSAEGAQRVAEELCSSVATAAIPHRGSRVAPHVTVSVGGVCLQGGTPPPEAAQQLVDAADRALYTAKQRGRNQAAFAPMT